MKKIFILFALSLLSPSQLKAHVMDNSQFGYVELGSIGGYPALGGGYRTQNGYHGFDISCKCTPWITLPAAELRGLYLFYPKHRGVYFGAGCGFNRELETKIYASPSLDAVIGYQWKTPKGREMFFQLEGIAPFKKKDSGPFIWPACSLGMSL